MGRKRLTNQEARIAKLEAELLEARRAQLAYDQKQFEQLEEQLDVSLRKQERLSERIEAEFANQERYDRLLKQSYDKAADMQDELATLREAHLELVKEHDEMLAGADNLPEEVTGA